MNCAIAGGGLMRGDRRCPFRARKGTNLRNSRRGSTLRTNEQLGLNGPRMKEHASLLHTRFGDNRTPFPTPNA